MTETLDNNTENYEFAYPLYPYFKYYMLKYKPFIWKISFGKFGKNSK